MKHSVTIISVLGLLLVTIGGAVMAQDGDSDAQPGFVSFQNDVHALQGIRPDGWQEAGPGIYARAQGVLDLTTLIAQSAPGFTAQQLGNQLLPQFGLDALPESVGSLQTDAFNWTLYQFEVTQLNLTVFIDLALAATEDRAYVAILQTGDETNLDALRADVFQPFLAALNPLNEAVVAPPYVDENAFTEREVQFGSDPYIINGTLSFPTGDGPFPAAVIVGGSGPADRNGTVGPNTPYRDLAQGLASQGIAVLRYDKRTLTYGTQIVDTETFTVDDEVTDDALLAAQFLRATTGIDPERVFVIGHSLGGQMTPRIAERDAELAGAALLAAPAREFETVVLEQIAYVSDVQNLSVEDNPTLADLARIAEGMQAIRAGTAPEEAFPLPREATYFASLTAVDQIATAQGLDLPLLILQPERDYQVTMADYSLWQQALEGADNVTFISYPDLMHSFMALGDLDQLAVPADNLESGNVAEQVINDIAEWILAR